MTFVLCRVRTGGCSNLKGGGHGFRSFRGGESLCGLMDITVKPLRGIYVRSSSSNDTLPEIWILCNATVKGASMQ